jgi:hypothetical protein
MYFSGSVEVFADIMVILFVFFRVSTEPEKYKKKSPLCQKTLPRILNNTKQPP